MEKENSIEFKVYGRRALFSDPIVRVGEKSLAIRFPPIRRLRE